MQNAAILEFGWVLLFAALAVMISARLRLPPVAGLLIAGMLIGPNALHLVGLQTIELFADLGAVLLLFMIGVQFSVAKILAGGLRPVISSFLLMLLTFAMMHESAILLGFNPITSLYIAAIFSMSSTAIMMKILEQKRLVERQEVVPLVTMLIIEDVIAVFLLAFFSSLRAGTYTSGNVAGSVLLSFGILALGYAALRVLVRKSAIVLLQHHPQDTLVLFAFTLGIGMSILASLLGLTPAIGAFLAGSIIAGLPNGREFEDAIRPFSQLFPSFFFISIGMLISPAALAESSAPAFLLIGMFAVTVFAATSFTFFLVSSSGRSSVFAGLAMLPLGEFSLLLAKESIGMAQINLVGVASAGVLITSLLCSFSLNRNERIYIALKKVLPRRFQEAQHDASAYFRNVISAFEPGGYFNRRLLTELRKVGTDLLYSFGVLLLLFFVRPYLQPTLPVLGLALPEDIALLALAAILLIIPAMRILLSTKRLFDALSVVFSRTTPQASKGVIGRNLVISAALFFLFLNTYAIVDLLMLPQAFNWFAPVFGALSAFFLWSAIRAASLRFVLTKGKPLGLFRSRLATSKTDIIVLEPSRKKGVEAGRRPAGAVGGRRVIFLR